MFHSKISGKKKLCLDAQLLLEDKTYQLSFTYSFRIDQAYFNMVQLGTDKYELRIDNQSFESLVKLEKAGKLKEKKSYNVIKNENNANMPRVIYKIPKEFYDSNDDDFDFSNKNNNYDKETSSVSASTTKEALSTRERHVDLNILYNEDLLQFNENNPGKVNSTNTNKDNNSICAENNKLDLQFYDPFEQNHISGNTNINLNNQQSNNNTVNTQDTKLEFLQMQLGNIYSNTQQTISQNNCINLGMPYIEQNQLNWNNNINMEYYPFQGNQSQSQQFDPILIQNPPSIKSNLNINVNNEPLNRFYYDNQQLNIQTKHDVDSFDNFFEETIDKQYDNQLKYQQAHHQTANNSIHIINNDVSIIQYN